MRYTIITSILIFFMSCNSGQQKIKSYINPNDKINRTSVFQVEDNVYSNFRYLNDSSMQAGITKWDMDIFIKNRNDTLLFDYIVMSQHFINTNGDSTEFSGYFFEKDIIENKIVFPIVNSYKKGFDSQVYFYRLQLEFSTDFDTVYWTLLDRVNHLPRKDTLIRINESFIE